ncbi:sorting nexin-24-like [Venturia canescens]|uniref:sorting nexin-24-like n=1 Tax=Venturia canescens TaxID=32260 RepID=UPI001C9D2A90|nr:sorting nexin-24-like [Venturia canescens]
MTLSTDLSKIVYSNDYDMYQVSISGYRLAEVTHGKRFYVYTIEVRDTRGGAKYSINRRYSEFNALHRALKKECDTAPFPPKRVRNSQPKVLEQRRIALEYYVQKMLRLETTKKQVLEFLGIEGIRQPENIRKRTVQESDTSRTNQMFDCPSIGHQPVMTFKHDPYLQTQSDTRLPDIVTQGVLLGIYKTANY